MQILALEKELKSLDPSADGALLREEAAAVWNLRKTGIVREIWFTRPARNAVLLLEVESATTARAVLETLPLVRERFIIFEILELAPYDGFERLFGRE